MKFEEAVEIVRHGMDSGDGAFPNVGVSDKLLLYGLYKVATTGLPPSGVPSVFSADASQKYSAWERAFLDFPDQEDAKSAYVRAVQTMQKKMSASS